MAGMIHIPDGARVYGTRELDVDGDKIIDGLGSRKKVYAIDPDDRMAGWHGIRAILSWTRRHPLIAVLSFLGVFFVAIPTATTSVYTMFRANPRYLTVGEAGGELPSAVNNFLVGARNTVGVGLDAAHEATIERNVGNIGKQVGVTQGRRANVE